MEQRPGSFLPGYTDSLIELSGISGHFANPSEALEMCLHSIGAVSFGIPDVIDGNGGRLHVSMTDNCVEFRRTLPNPDTERLWMTRDAVDKYELLPDGTVLNQAAPEGKKVDLSTDSLYPIKRILKTQEEIAALANKLRLVKEYLEDQPPIDWSENRSISLPMQ